MKIKSIILPLFAVFVLAVSPVAVAADAEGEYGNFSAGIYSCAKILKHEKEDGWSHLVNSAWVRGYLTATGYHLKTIKAFHRVVDSDGIDYLVRQYCEKNPLDDLEDAAKNVAEQVLDRAGRR